ncbi:uncharacterized protein [Amphiura filiformis]|uniref:uncharacterized protein n=1 Tax=Amphiura filiformis TaxID=82378 RepID=UPI003B21FC27
MFWNQVSTPTNELIRVGESAASAYGPNSSVDVLESDHSSLSSGHRPPGRPSTYHQGTGHRPSDRPSIYQQGADHRPPDRPSTYEQGADNRPPDRPSTYQQGAGHRLPDRPSTNQQGTIHKPSDRPSTYQQGAGRMPSDRPSTYQHGADHRPSEKPSTYRQGAGHRPSDRPSTYQQGTIHKPSDRPSTYQQGADQHQQRDKEVTVGKVADSTQDLIREGESLAKKYEADAVPTRDKDPVRGLPATTTTTEIVVQVQVMQCRCGVWVCCVIREGESLTKKYEADGAPTRDKDPVRGLPATTTTEIVVSTQELHLYKDPVRGLPATTTTEIVVSTQNVSISTASSASWPEEPHVPTTKPPNEFDTIGLGLRARSDVDKELTVDSLVRGIGREEIGSHQHVHTHHHDHRTTNVHYHQPVVIPGDPDPIYASSLPQPLPSSSSDSRRRHPTDPLPDRAAAISRPASSSTSHQKPHDNVPHRVRSRPYTSGAIPGEVPFTDKGVDGIRDPNHRYGSSYRHTTSKQVPSVTDDIQPSLRISSIAKRAINVNNSAKDGDIDKQSQISADRISRYQADKLTTSGDLRHLLSSSREDRIPGLISSSRDDRVPGLISSSRDDRVPGLVPSSREERVPGFISSTTDRPFSLASERYKTYLSSRLEESGARAKTDQQTSLPAGLATDRQSRTYPPYETIDKFMPSRPEEVSEGILRDQTRPEDSSTSKQPSGGILRDHSSQDASKTRQSNLTIDSHVDDISDRYTRFDDEDDIARRPGRRIAFEDEDVGAVSGSYASRPRFTKEVIPLESDSDMEDLGTRSDTEVDYSPQPDRRVVVRRDEHDYNLRSRLKRPRSKKHVGKKRSVLLPPTSRPNLKVKFEDALDADAKGELGKIRKKLHKEKNTQERQKQVLQTVYASNLKEVQQTLKQQTARRKQRMQQEDKQYREHFGKTKASKYQPAKKYTAKVSAPESLSRQSRPVTRRTSGKRKRSASSSPTINRQRRPLHIGDDEMLPTVMQEFPFLHVSPHTAHNMWSKQMRQMEQLTKSGLDLPTKNKTQIKMEEAEKRQETLLKIMKKELSHNQRMRDIKERQATERTMTSKAREQKQVTARARRYYDEFRLRAQSRMMKRRNREEQIFKKLFDDGLAIQKSRIREMRQYAREKREQISARQQDEIDSLENYYRDQFSMLAETIAKERHQLQVRDDAQNKVMEQMKREMRRKMEREIRDFQEQLYRDEDTEYFRQIEADRMRKELQMANYKTLL